MLRIVLDSTVLVFGLLRPRTCERLVLTLALRRRFVPLVSQAIWTEYGAVLRRAELRLDLHEASEVLAELRKVAEFVFPARAVEPTAPIERSDRFLDAAAAGNADYLVTGSTRGRAAEHGRTRIVDSREMIEILAPQLRRLGAEAGADASASASASSDLRVERPVHDQ